MMFINLFLSRWWTKYDRHWMFLYIFKGSMDCKNLAKWLIIWSQYHINKLAPLPQHWTYYWKCHFKVFQKFSLKRVKTFKPRVQVQRIIDPGSASESTIDVRRELFLTHLALKFCETHRHLSARRFFLTDRKPCFFHGLSTCQGMVEPVFAILPTLGPVVDNDCAGEITVEQSPW